MLALHIAVFLFGLAGVLGKFLTVPSTAIVLSRTAIGALVLAPVVYARVAKREVLSRAVIALIPSGALLAFHWFTFFYAIQLSSVATGLLSYATFPIFVVFIEPLVLMSSKNRSKGDGSRAGIHKRDLLNALLVAIGLVLVIPSYDFNDRFFRGILWGILSAFSFALLTVLNRRTVAGVNPLAIGLFQNLWAAVCLSPFYAPLLALSATELVTIVILGLFCTALAHTLFIDALASVRPQLASVTAALEPVNGIILGLLVLGEVPTSREIVGGFFIIGVVAASSWSSNPGPTASSLSQSVHN
jgi:drug/metabolite transporter (DMT)-like permease